VAACKQRWIAGNTEMLDHGERVVGEAAPRVRLGLGVEGSLGEGGAVAVAAEIERPHVSARGHEPLRNRRPHPPVEARGVGKERRRTVSAQSWTASSPTGPLIMCVCGCVIGAQHGIFAA